MRNAYLKRSQAVREHVVASLDVLGYFALLNEGLEFGRLCPRCHLGLNLNKTSTFLSLRLVRPDQATHSVTALIAAPMLFSFASTWS